MQNNDNVIKSEVPIGLSMALAQNIDALKQFSKLSESAQQAIIKKSHSVNSKAEMQALVSSITA